MRSQIIADLDILEKFGLLSVLHQFTEHLKQSAVEIERQKGNIASVLAHAGCMSDEDSDEIRQITDTEFNQIEGDPVSMKKLALDTNFAVDLLNGKESVKQKINEIADVICLPAVVSGELLYGAKNSAKRYWSENTCRFVSFCSLIQLKSNLFRLHFSESTVLKCLQNLFANEILTYNNLRGQFY